LTTSANSLIEQFTLIYGLGTWPKNRLTRPIDNALKDDSQMASESAIRRTLADFSGTAKMSNFVQTRLHEVALIAS